MYTMILVISMLLNYLINALSQPEAEFGQARGGKMLHIMQIKGGIIVNANLKVRNRTSLIQILTRLKNVIVQPKLRNTPVASRTFLKRQRILEFY